jgi:excinuclease UvrABC ATPase subunit
MRRGRAERLTRAPWRRARVQASAPAQPDAARGSFDNTVPAWPDLAGRLIRIHRWADRGSLDELGDEGRQAATACNETSSAFVQGFMPTLARPEVDVLEGLTTPHIGSSNAFSFNVPSVRAVGAMTVEKGPGKLAGGAISVPGYASDGWYVRVFAAAGLDPDKPIRKYTKQERHTFLYDEPRKVKVEKLNLTHEGLIPKIQKAFLSKDVDALQPHIRAFVERAVTFTTCPDCEGTRFSAAARSSKIKGKNIADVCDMQISAWRRGFAA